MEAIDYRGFEIRPFKKLDGSVYYYARGFGNYHTLEDAKDTIDKWLEENIHESNG